MTTNNEPDRLDVLFTRKGQFNNAAILEIMNKITAEDFMKIIELGAADNDPNGGKILDLLVDIYERNT